MVTEAGLNDDGNVPKTKNLLYLRLSTGVDKLFQVILGFLTFEK